MLKEGNRVIEKRGIKHIEKNGIINKFNSWSGDLFAYKYDEIMEKRVFPKLFNADTDLHDEILRSLYKRYRGKEILELGTGSGNASRLLNKDNSYTGVDIGSRLLRKAKASFETAGFDNYSLYLSSADDLPFEDDCFDLCICNLSLNFFPNLEKVLEEIGRVLRSDGVFLCSIAVLEKMEKGNRIRGTQFTLRQLKNIMRNSGFTFSVLSEGNGALVYFGGYSLKEEKAAL